jgi:hypothetical protein
MIAGTEQVVTEELSLPRMSDGEDNDDLYDSDVPSEESERDEDSPQGSRVDICWETLVFLINVVFLYKSWRPHKICVSCVNIGQNRSLGSRLPT